MNAERAVSIMIGASGGNGRAFAVGRAARHGRIVAAAGRPSAMEETPGAIPAHGGEMIAMSGDVCDVTIGSCLTGVHLTTRAAVEDGSCDLVGRCGCVADRSSRP